MSSLYWSKLLPRDHLHGCINADSLCHDRIANDSVTVWSGSAGGWTGVGFCYLQGGEMQLVVGGTGKLERRGAVGRTSCQTSVTWKDLAPTVCHCNQEGRSTWNLWRHRQVEAGAWACVLPHPLLAQADYSPLHFWDTEGAQDREVCPRTWCFPYSHTKWKYLPALWHSAHIKQM